MTGKEGMGVFVYSSVSDDGRVNYKTSHDLRLQMWLLENSIYIFLYIVHKFGAIVYFCGNFLSGKADDSQDNEKKDAHSQNDLSEKLQKNISTKLTDWFDQEYCEVALVEERTLPVPESEWRRILLIGCFYCAHVKVSISMCSPTFQNLTDITPLKKEVTEFLYSIESSRRFRHVCHRLVLFFRCFINSSSSEIHDFFRNVSASTQNIPCGFFVRQCYWFANVPEQDKNKAEVVMAFCSIFMKRNAHFTTHYLRKGFLHRDPALSGALELIYWFAIRYCGFDNNDISTYKSTQNGTFDTVNAIRSLTFESGKRFEPVFSGFVGRDLSTTKQVLLWDFSINLCHDFVEEAWSVELMERAAWALDTGRHFLTKDAFDMLQRNKMKPKVNLTFHNVRTLLALSISGLVKFTGFDGCIFNLTGSDDALLCINGYLRKPTLKDLVDLKLVQETKHGWFQALDFPGSWSGHKGVKIADQILFVRSQKNVPFRAVLEQRVG